MIAIDKSILDTWINIDNISYTEIGRRLQCSVSYVKKYAEKLGIVLPKRTTTENVIPWNKGIKKQFICKNCGEVFSNSNGVFQQFCCSKCSAEYRSKAKYQDYINNQESFTGREISYKWLKPFILKEQDNKCAICRLSTIWNNKELHFILDHIDGDATNNTRNNLRLICPNCDSQLDTFKSRNKWRSTRKYKPYREAITGK